MGEVLGKNYQAFVFPPCSPCCWLCVTWKTDWDHSLQAMWKCSLLVRAGSPSSAAELSGDKDKAVGGMSASHFPSGKPSPSGQHSEETEQLPRLSRVQCQGNMSVEQGAGRMNGRAGAGSEVQGAKTYHWGDFCDSSGQDKH